MQEKHIPNFTLIHGNRKTDARPVSLQDNHRQTRYSRTHSNALLRHMVAKAREQLPPKRKKLDAYSCNRLAAAAAMAALDYLCSHFKETNGMAGARDVVAGDLALIIAQLEESHDGEARERGARDSKGTIHDESLLGVMNNHESVSALFSFFKTKEVEQ